MNTIKLALLEIGLLNILVGFFLTGYLTIFNIIAGWICCFDALSNKSIFDYILIRG